MHTEVHAIKFNKLAVLAAVVFALGLEGCAHHAQAPDKASGLEKAQSTLQAAAEKPTDGVPPPPSIVEQPALDRLKAMSDKLVAAKAFSYRARSTVELPAKTGQFVTHFIESEVALERPNKLRFNVAGDVPGFHFYYDGANVTAFDPQKNLYATAKAPATIDAMLPFVTEKIGIDFPSADLLTSDPYAELTKGLTHAIAIGPSKVNGVACEHFAFIGPVSNWEIWIESGANALPRRVAVTYKTVENFPRFLVEYRDWNLAPKLSAAQFTFKKPAGAKQIEFGSRVGQSAQ
jgi:hypothetical protein